MAMVVNETKLNAAMTATADAIREKLGSEEQIPFDYNGGTGFADAVEAIPQGGGGVVSITEGALFIDYDGTLLYGWSSDEVASQTKLPDNPSHTGMVAEGWNWTLEQIKSYIAEYPRAIVVVGQLYTTASGKTEFDIEVYEDIGLTVECHISGEKDWGDGTVDTLETHTYASSGSYTISCSGTTTSNGSDAVGVIFGSRETNANRLWCVSARIASGFVFGSHALNNCMRLQRISFPRNVTVQHHMMRQCWTLRAWVLASDVPQYFHYQGYGLSYASIIDGATIGTAAIQASSLKAFTLPRNIITIPSDFLGRTLLPRIVFPKTVTSIAGSAFNENRATAEYDFSKCEVIPTLTNSYSINQKNNIIKVPRALMDDWKTATNWTAMADRIVGV